MTNDQLKNILQLLIGSGTNAVTQALNQLKQINACLTEISTANDALSKSDLAQITAQAFDAAGKYGKQATDYLSALQEASRAGHENAKGIAELSLALQNAGNLTEDIANQYISATDKAYQLNGSVSELTKIFDGANQITNEHAVNLSELAIGMDIVGSTAASLGIGANETTAALATMIATTQQSGSEAANALKTILLNISNDCSASLRDPMEVLHELSVEYRKLGETDIGRTNPLFSVSENVDMTQLDALLGQWNTYEQMLGEYEAGTDSIALKAEKMADSWEGSMNRLNNSWTMFIDSLTNQDAVIGTAEALSGLLNGITAVTEKTGALPPVLAGITAYLGKGKSI